MEPSLDSLALSLSGMFLIYLPSDRPTLEQADILNVTGMLCGEWVGVDGISSQDAQEKDQPRFSLTPPPALTRAHARHQVVQHQASAFQLKSLNLKACSQAHCRLLKEIFAYRTSRPMVTQCGQGGNVTELPAHQGHGRHRSAVQETSPLQRRVHARWARPVT